MLAYITQISALNFLLAILGIGLVSGIFYIFRELTNKSQSLQQPDDQNEMTSIARSASYVLVEAVVLFIWGLCSLLISPILLGIIGYLTQIGILFMFAFFSITLLAKVESPPFLIFTALLALSSLLTAFHSASDKKKRIFICAFAVPVSALLAYLTQDYFRI